MQQTLSVYKPIATREFFVEKASIMNYIPISFFNTRETINRYITTLTRIKDLIHTYLLRCETLDGFKAARLREYLIVIVSRIRDCNNYLLTSSISTILFMNIRCVPQNYVSTYSKNATSILYCSLQHNFITASIFALPLVQYFIK